MTFRVSASAKAGVVAYFSTKSLREDIKSNLEYKFNYDYNDLKDLDNEIIHANIGPYEFDIHEVQCYSDTTKNFLEEIMLNDDVKKLKAFYRVAKSKKRVLLSDNDIDLNGLLGYKKKNKI